MIQAEGFALQMEFYYHGPTKEKIVYDTISEALTEQGLVVIHLFETNQPLNSQEEEPLEMTDIHFEGIKRKGYKLLLKYSQNPNINPHIIIYLIPND